MYNQLLWGFEKNLNIGDYALLFVNPDFSPQINNSTKGNYVTSEEASKHFDLVTETSFEYGLKKKFLKNLRTAFIEVFQELTDFEEIKMHKKGAESEHNFKNDVANNIKNFADRLDTNENPNDPSMANQSINNPQGYSVDPINLKSNNSKINIPEMNDKSNQQLGPSFLNIPNGPDKKSVNLSKISKNDEKSKSKKKKPKVEKKTNQQFEDEEMKKGDIRKIFAGGKFLKYQGHMGGDQSQRVQILRQQYVNNPDDPNFHKKKLCEQLWAKTANGVRDYLTLIRQLIYVIFAYQGVIIREFVSSNGELIIAVCYGHTNNIKKMAESMGISKPLDIALIDLMSLEPVDGKNRPLRANEVLWNKKKWKLEYFKTRRTPLVRNEPESKSLVENPILHLEVHDDDKPESIASARKKVSKKVEESSAMHKQKLLFDDESTNDLLEDWQVSVDKVWVDEEMNNRSVNTSSFHNQSCGGERSFVNDESFNLNNSQISGDHSIKNEQLEMIDTSELQNRILKLIQRINFKLIVRKCGGTWEKSDANNE